MRPSSPPRATTAEAGRLMSDLFVRGTTGDGYRQLLLVWDRAGQGNKRPESFNAVAQIEGALLPPCEQEISFDAR